MVNKIIYDKIKENASITRFLLSAFSFDDSLEIEERIMRDFKGFDECSELSIDEQKELLLKELYNG